jgi:hypothetical protein
MRSLDQNVRQRASQATKQGTGDKAQRSPAPKSWKIAPDDGYESTSSGNKIPMYNPLHYSDETSDIPSSPSSLPSTRQSHDQSKYSLLQAPGSLEGLRSSQLHSLAPPMIPDSSYQDYLKGRSLKRKRSSPVDKICFAKFCALFSWVGILFLLFVGIMIDTQPMYIQGVLIKNVQYGDNNKAQAFYDLSQSERLPTASTAYCTAFVYFLTGCASLAYAYNFQFWFNSRRRQYHDIPDADATAHDSETKLPAFNPKMKAYQHDNGVGARIWNMTALTTNRAKMQVKSMWPRYRETHRVARRRQSGAKDV